MGWVGGWRGGQCVFLPAAWWFSVVAAECGGERVDGGVADLGGDLAQGGEDTKVAPPPGLVVTDDHVVQSNRRSDRRELDAGR